MHSPQCSGAVFSDGQPSVAADFTRSGYFQRSRSSSCLLSCFLAFVLSLLSQALRAAEIATDYWDYPPFSEVVITGSGFQAGEEVQLRLETLGEDGVTWTALPDDPVWPNPWTVTATASGGILDTWLVYTEDFLGVSFRLTATGSQSNESAVTNFTDAAGAYSINFAAADPAIYIPPIPFPENVTAIVGRGDGDTEIPSAWFESPDTNADVKVESLAPEAMALHQVVPFEIKVTVDGDTTPENGTITFTAGWSIKTTSAEDFGYDEIYGVIAAFVDTGDGAHHDPGGDATVSNFSWNIVGDEIVGSFEISGLDDDDVVVIEPWLVLEDTIPTGSSKPTGNVQSRLISAETVPKGDKAISTGNQTVPLKPGEFFRASADLEITKSADPVCLGEDLTYTILVTNNSTDTVANEIVVTDTLGANQTFVSSDGAPASVLGQVVTFDVGALAAGDSIELTVVVTPTAGGSVENDVVVTAITDDPEEDNNTASTETDVHAMPACEITLDSVLVLGHTATFKSDAGAGTYEWSVSFNDGAPVDVDADVDGEVEILIPEDAIKGTVYLTITNGNGCESTCEFDLETFEPDCDALLPPTCPGIDQELELDLTPPDGSEIVWSIEPDDGAAVLEVDPEDETKATVSSATCAQYTVTVTVTPPGGTATICEISGSFEDSTNPELPELPAGGYLGCNPPPPTCDDTLEATDDCGPIPVICTPGNVTNDGCMRSQDFTYSAEDACGNKVSDTVTYTWKEDTVDPVLPTLPTGGDLGCNPELPQCTTGLVASDNCDGTVEVTCTPGEITGEGCVKSQVFTYSAEDGCENKVSDTVTFTWTEDTTDPVLPTLPTGGDLGCNPEELPQCVDDLMADDNCGQVEVKCSAGEITGEGCAKSQIFTYSAEDACGNKVSDTVTYIWSEDTSDPVLPTLPTGGDLGCNPEELPQCDDTLLAEDNCGQVEVKCSAGEITGEGCAKSQIFTYSAEDACGNKVSDTVTYIWSEDTSDPVLPTLPTGGDLGCNPELPKCVDDLMADDNCGQVEVKCSAGEITGEGCAKSQIFTYSAEDACGNKVSDTVTYIWSEDTSDPVLPTLPTGGDLGCNPELPKCVDDLMAEDNCGQVEVKCSAGEITGEGCAKSQIFTYSAEDACGNKVSDTVTYTWTEDTTQPELPQLPDGGYLGCNPELPACVEDLMASDVCGGDIPVECTAGDITGDGCEKTQIFTYKAKDGCGNEISDTVTYTWTEDTDKPELPTLPQGGDLGCNPELPKCVEVDTASDLCGGDIDVECTPGEITGEGCEKSQTFTYSAEDACGNKATDTVTYTWTEDEEDPEITCPPEMQVAFPGVPAPATTVEELEELGGSASDTCSDVTISSTDSEPTGDCPRTFTRTYKATDGCGNESTCEQTITQYCPSLVTSSSLCTFDMDKECEDAFRLAFHQRGDSPGLYKITNTNPGQFYYNVFLTGNEGDPVDLSVTIPYPFVTHGAQPIHVYGDYTVTGSDETGYCLVPGTQAPGFTIGTATGVDGVQNYSPSGAEIIVMGDYSLASQTTTVTVNGGTIPASGTLVVTIHLDFGLKATKEWTPVSGAAVGSGALTGVQLDPCEAYTFSFADAGLGLDDVQVVHSVNSFKKNPGFGASVVLKSDLGGGPLKGVKFEAWNATGTTKIGEGFTDADGAGMISYKHKAKPDDYWIKVPAYQKAIKVTVKANGFGMGEFEVP